MSILTIAIAIAAIFFLVLLHELGHFLLAKRFGIKVEEFGIGLPFTPPLLKKKFGETTYTFYPLLIGAFVKMLGEEQAAQDPRSFSVKPIWQRFAVVAGGVASSWIIAAVIIGSAGSIWGIPMAVADDDETTVENPQVHISMVVSGSPADEAGIRPGDVVQHIEHVPTGKILETTQVREVQDFIAQGKGEELRFVLQRGDQVVDVALVPREDPPPGEGAMGVMLARAGQLTFPWYEAPYHGVVLTGTLTSNIVIQTGTLIQNAIAGEGPPIQDQVAGPVGIVNILQGTLEVGYAQFFLFVALIAIYLAIFNTLPIPALDGGRMVFLLVEAIVRRPVPEKVVQILIIGSFAILLPLIIWVTIQDIQRL